MIKKIIIKNTEKVLLIFILIASVLSIINKQLSVAIKIAINVLMILFLCRKEKLKVIKSKLDICVLMLVISSIIPIIFNKYVSLVSALSTVLDYITLFWIYLISREICKKESNVRFLKNAIIIITLFLIGIGIENLTTNKILELIGFNNLINGEQRLVSLLANPNTFAGLIMLSSFISINEMINTESIKIKRIYEICNSIFILAILLTYSKIAYIIFPISIVIFLLFVKEKEKRKNIIQNICMSLLASIVYIYIFNILVECKYYLAIWIFMILWIEILYCLNKIINKNLKRFNIKRYVVIVFVLFLLLVGYIVVGLQIKEEFIICREGISTEYKSRIINNIEPNKKYVLKFTMEAKSEINDKEDIFIIRILERDSKSLDALKSYEYKFGNFSGEKEIELTTLQNTTEIKLEFEIKYKDKTDQWSIDRLMINEKEIILEYKLLPTKLVNKVRDINIHYRTFEERIHFWKDGFKLISKNFLTGIGGDNWKYSYNQVQEYGYVTNDVHSYYIQIWLEFGLLGLLAILGIIIIIASMKCKDRNVYLGIKIGILVLLLHSAVDSDMYYINMRIILFMILGCLSATNSIEVLKNKKYFINKIVILIVSIIALVLILKPEIYNKKLEVESLEAIIKNVEIGSDEYKKYNKEIAKKCTQILKRERDSETRNRYGTKRAQAYINSDEKDLEKVVEQYYEEVARYKNDWRYDANKIISKSSDITIINKMLDKENNLNLYSWIIKLAEINLKEYEENESQLKSIYDNKNLDMKNQLEYKILKDNYYDALNIYKKYIDLLQPKDFSNAMYNLNKELVYEITTIQKDNPHGEYFIDSTRTSWKEVLAVYMVCTNTESITPDKILEKDERDILRNIFFDMNEINTEKSIGLYQIEGLKILRLHIHIVGKTTNEIASIYNFTDEQKNKLNDILQNYDFSWIDEDVYKLKENNEIIKVASSEVGNIGGEPYWKWYGYRERVDWCACFVSWCADNCEYLSNGILPKFAVCQTEGIDFFKACDLWRENKEYIPKAGDIIFFDWKDSGDGVADHVGLVEKVENNLVYTIEGNSQDECKRKSYDINSEEIMGYGTPMY